MSSNIDNGITPDPYQQPTWLKYADKQQFYLGKELKQDTSFNQTAYRK